MEKNAELSKNLNQINVWSLALGSIVGWGAFVMPGDSFLPQSGPLGTLLGILLGALVMIVISCCYGYMVKQYPVAGGAFAFAYKEFGRIHAFICGWFLGLTYISIVSLNATALGVVGRYMFPGILQKGYLFSIANWEVYLGEILLANLVIILFGYISIKGVKVSGMLQTILAFSLISSVIIIFISSIISPKTSLSNLYPLFSPKHSRLGAVLTTFSIAPWAFIGFDSIPQSVEEYSFPPKKAINLMFFAILIGAFVYTTMNFVTASIFPWQSFLDTEPFWPTGTAVNELLGKIGFILLAIALVAAILSGIIGFYSSSSRLMLSMSRASVLPKWFGKIHPQYKTPSNALLFIMFLSLVGPWLGRQVLQWIVDMCSVGAAIGYLYTSASTFKTLYEKKGELGMKLISVGSIIFSLIFIAVLLIPGLPSSLSMPSLIFLVFWIILGIIFYFFSYQKYHTYPSKEIDV